MRFDSARAVARTLTAPVVLTIALALAPANSALAQKRGAVIDSLLKAPQKKALTPAEKAARSHAPAIKVRKDTKGMKGFAANVDCSEVLESASDYDAVNQLAASDAVTWLRCAARRSGASLVAGGTTSVGTGDDDVSNFSMSLAGGRYLFAVVADSGTDEVGFGISGPGRTDDDAWMSHGHLLVKNITLDKGDYRGTLVANGSASTVNATILIFRYDGDEE